MTLYDVAAVPVCACIHVCLAVYTAWLAVYTAQQNVRTAVHYGALHRVKCLLHSCSACLTLVLIVYYTVQYNIVYDTS
jgi:hypothetical protein